MSNRAEFFVVSTRPYKPPTDKDKDPPFHYGWLEREAAMAKKNQKSGIFLASRLVNSQSGTQSVDAFLHRLKPDQQDGITHNPVEGIWRLSPPMVQIIIFNMAAAPHKPEEKSKADKFSLYLATAGFDLVVTHSDSPTSIELKEKRPPGQYYNLTDTSCADAMAAASGLEFTKGQKSRLIASFKHPHVDTTKGVPDPSKLLAKKLGLKQSGTYNIGSLTIPV